MADIKEYTVTLNDRHEVVVKVDHDILTEAKLHEINNFWSGSTDRLYWDKNVLHAVLKLLAAEVFRQSITAVNVRAAFNEGNGIEGWPRLDGSEGIELGSFDDMTFEPSDMEVSEA